jgi:hypothetical protein
MTTSILNTPILWVNTYLQEKLQDFGIERIPFFPSTPSTVNDITENVSADGLMATYDRMISLRRNPFPHIKTEQILYYFYATSEDSVVNIIKIVEGVQRLLDREDESAEEINAWALSKNTIAVEGEDLLRNYNFHNFKVYQLQETRNIINFNSVGTYDGAKIIIQYEYNSLV